MEENPMKHVRVFIVDVLATIFRFSLMMIYIFFLYFSTLFLPYFFLTPFTLCKSVHCTVGSVLYYSNHVSLALFISSIFFKHFSSQIFINYNLFSTFQETFLTNIIINTQLLQFLSWLTLHDPQIKILFTYKQTNKQTSTYWKT